MVQFKGRPTHLFLCSHLPNWFTVWSSLHKHQLIGVRPNDLKASLEKDPAIKLLFSQLVFTPIALFSGLWCLVMHSFKHQNLNIWGQLILNTGFQQGLFKKICKGKNVYQTKKFLLNEKLWKTFFSRIFFIFFLLEV